jgi:agmatine deiminase
LSFIIPGAASAFSSDQSTHASDDVNKFALSPASAQPYVQRGDWEPPDVLLVVEFEEWQESVDAIISAAHADMTPVYVLKNSNDQQYREHMMPKEQSSDSVSLHISLDSPWVRDYGPLQLKTHSGSFKWIDFAYKIDRLNDDAMPDQLAKLMGASLEHGDYLLDGGAVISNGNGLCAITDKSLEDAAVDPLEPEAFEDFKDILGCEALAVLPALTGESTGHADISAQFLSPELVAVAKIYQKGNHAVSRELEETVTLLKSAAEKIDQPLTIIRLPLIVDDEYFYSYINGTRLKDTYLIPSFHNVPSEIEDNAVNAVQSALPDIELTLIPSDAIVMRGGAVHCITLGLNLPGPMRQNQFWAKKFRKALSSGSILFY